MAKIEYRLHTPDVRAASAVTRARLQRIVQQIAFAIQSGLVRNSPVSKDPGVTGGNLANNWDVRFRDAGGQIVAEVTNTTPYLKWIISGTGIYGPYGVMIRPIEKKALAFTIGGTLFIRRAVRGMKPNDFISETLDELKPELDAIVAQEMSGWLLEKR